MGALGSPGGAPSRDKELNGMDVIVLDANAPIPLCPPLSPATTERTPRRPGGTAETAAGFAATTTSSGGPGYTFFLCIQCA